MNKHEIALEKINKKIFNEESKIGLYEGFALSEDIKLIKDLVERATPKEPFDYQNQGISECKCGWRVYEDMKFCAHCGQALKWSDS